MRVKPLDLYLDITLRMVSMMVRFVLELHKVTVMKLIFMDRVTRKGRPFTKRKSMAR